MRPCTQAIVLCGLILGCALAPLPVSAQSPCSGAGCLGSAYPALVDTNENGMPDPGIDDPITISPSAAMITIGSPWACNPFSGRNMIFFRDSVGGRWMTTERFTGNGRTQRVEIDPGAIVGGRPTLFLFTEIRPASSDRAGSGQLMDDNGDGFYDRMIGQETGGGLMFDMSFVGADVGGVRYISIPWAMANVVGVRVGDGCGPAGTSCEDPQVWIPMADTDGDQVGDSIVPDLTGDSIDDAEFHWSPRLGVAAASGVAECPASALALPIPTLSSTGVALVILGLAFSGWLVLRRHWVIA